ncbi:MAG: hypothetical protein QXY65_03710 [Candidatus Methanomethylicaceae archaeon]
MLDRLLIAKTKLPSREDIMKILEIKAINDGIELDKTALEFLTEIGVKHTLRYAAQLLQPSKIIAEIMNSNIVKIEHIERAKNVFMDVRDSMKYLEEELSKDPIFSQFLK